MLGGNSGKTPELLLDEGDEVGRLLGPGLGMGKGLGGKFPKS